MLLALALPAFAALPTFTDVGFLLTAPAEGAFVGGVNAPTVAWDGAQWVMYFESPAPSDEVPSDCSSSYRIGRATSPDGLVWTLDETPVLVPDRADTSLAYSCSVAQPAVVFDGSTWHMFFSMGDEKPNSTGTNVNAGIGYATSPDGVTFTVVEAPSGPAVLVNTGGDGSDTGMPVSWEESRTSLGMASVALVEDELLVMFVGSGQLYLARMGLASGQWTLVEDPAIAKGVDPVWMGGSLFSPALNCDLATGLTAYFGAFTDSTGAVRNFGLATSTDVGLSWTVEPDAPFSSTVVPFASINHVETVQAGADTRLYYSMTDSATGLKAIGLALTGTTGGAPGGRVCVTAPDTGDTGDTGVVDTGDTGAPVDTGDSGTPVDTGDSGVVDSGDPADTDSGVGGTDAGLEEDDAKGGCGCSPVGDPVGAGAVAMGLAALAARRRRRA